MENETRDTINAKEIQELLQISHQALSRLKWMPECINRNKKGMRIFDKQAVIAAIEKQYSKPKEHVYVIEPNRFYDAMKDLVTATEKGFVNKNINRQYSKYKIVQNRGDIVLACQLKRDTSRPWIYERRRETVKCDWMIK